MEEGAAGGKARENAGAARRLMCVVGFGYGFTIELLGFTASTNVHVSLGNGELTCLLASSYFSSLY